MNKKGNIWIWRSEDRILDLRDVIYMRHRWHNYTKSFEGYPLNSLSRHITLERIQDSDELPIAAVSKFVFDEPDYAVFSSGTPILWHSTTTAKLETWVAPLTVSDFPYRQGLNTALEIVCTILPWLNETELDDSLPLQSDV